MRKMNQEELSLVSGGDGEPGGVTFLPHQSSRDIQNILDAIHRLYAGPAAP